jgi:hypothetical protein
VGIRAVRPEARWKSGTEVLRTLVHLYPHAAAILSLPKAQDCGPQQRWGESQVARGRKGSAAQCRRAGLGRKTMQVADQTARSHH